MDFYEELGLGPHPSPEEIHRAYKRLAKQFHPDKHSTDVRRRWAEAQMRRLNEIFETLSDPGKRANYDESVRSLTIGQIADWQEIEAALAQRTARRKLATILGLSLACVAGAGFVLLAFFDGQLHLGNTIPGAKEALAAATATQPAVEVAHFAPAKPSAGTAAPPHPNPPPVPAIEEKGAPVGVIASAPQPVVAAASTPVRPPPDPPVAQTTKVVAVTTTPVETSWPAANDPLVQPPAKAAAPQKPTLAGTWIFSPAKAVETKLPFSAEYVEITVKVVNDRVTGKFRGNYNVRNSTLPPRVQFHFEGAESELSEGITWKAENGAEGLIKFHMLSDTELEIGWYTTRFVASPSLTSGNAILTRESSEPTR